MVKQNLGTVDRVLRFALAFWLLGPWALQYSMGWINGVLFVVGWIALIESFIGWCWIHTIIHINNKNQ
ncbi:MAG: hypothetical protein QT02_C0004G0043 [archaeon GW2011_AR9]|nr:MAG: hypothetical protein QT02_C0004G0043 [archaeon GW2011_AR9]MBS3120387.1 DUF2892 domain-containing protein [Candidatus Woesearchaeota archaeon]HIG93133.1 DUF2892 domain-containing protein [Candidatus Woesearchaeota archaeon]HIH13146.1 DUF2892 domain-containing protein [Candidatus Woesearchaeota archaeon]